MVDLMNVYGRVDMNESTEITEITEENINKAIENLMSLAYKDLIKEPKKYLGDPTCDYIACFLDSKKAALDDEKFQEKFQEIFNNAVANYKDRWAEFEKEIIEPKLNKILDIVYEIEKYKEASDLISLRNSKFDSFSTNMGAICNKSVASAIYTVCMYTKINKDWIKSNGRKNKLEKCFKLLMKTTRIPKKGWQYYFLDERDNYVHTLPTWLSLVALNNTPEEIITEELKKEIEGIKGETIDWLKSNVRRKDSYCSWYFIPDDTRDEEYTEYINRSANAVATAQAVLALYHCKFNSNKELKELINCSINFIKKETTSVTRPVHADYVPVSKTRQDYPGIQHCLQALLINLPPDDKAVFSLLDEVVKLATTKTQKAEAYYQATLLPLLWYLYPSSKPVPFKPPTPLPLSDLSDSKRQFESFVAGAEAVVLIGEIDSFYAKLIEDSQVTQVTVIYRESQEENIFKNRRWEPIKLSGDKIYALENINCLIANGTKALLSSTPFKKLDSKYGFCKHLKGNEVSALIKQIEEITKTKITLGTDVIEQIHELEGVKDFSKHWNIYMKSGLMDVGVDVQKGILEYFKFTPGYTEIKGSALGLSDNKKVVEKELSKRGIFSRIFIDHDLKNLLEKSVSEDFTPHLVLDESSAYLLLNTEEGTEEEKKVIRCCSACLGKADLYVVSEIYDKLVNKLKKFLEEEIDKARFDRIIPIKKEEDYLKKYFDESIQHNEKYQLTTNEKIAISQVAQGSDFGIITNSWEVAKVCKENKNKDKEEIKTFSVMKFLEEEKDEKIYKIFRIPIDEI